MASPCYYHPAASSSGSASSAVCLSARIVPSRLGESRLQEVRPASKARMEQQMAVAPAASQGRPAPYAGYAPPAYGGAPGAAAPPAYGRAAVSQRSDFKEVLMGIGLGLVIGIIGAVIIEKILFFAHFGLSLLYVAMGYGIGWGIHRVTGRGGTGLALAAVGVMAVALFVGQLFYAQDVLNMVRDAGTRMLRPRFLTPFPSP